VTPGAHATLFAALFGGLAIALFLLNGWNAYHPTDDGFILAYAWRVANGEVPYRDFLFVRMPLTPYLHSVVMLLPDGWQIQTGRLSFFLELALSGALPSIWAVHRLGMRATPRALGLAAICFLFAVHNFPPMPWPTVDAVMFASAGATAFLFSLDAPGRRALVLRGAASLLLALAVLSKQAFAPLPVLLVAYAVVEALRARRPGRLLASVVPGALLGALALGTIAAAGALPFFLQQIAEPTQLRESVAVPWTGDPIAIGVEPYVRALTPLAVAGMLLAFALAWTRGRTGRWISLVRGAGGLGVFAALVALAVEAQLDPFTAGLQLFWMLVAAGAGLLATPLDRTGRLTLVAFASILALAWCASLSFAYKTPLLGLAGAGFLLESAFPRGHWTAHRYVVLGAAAAVAFGIIRLQLDQPYREVPRALQTADLGEIYPRFGRMLTNQSNYERFRELRDLTGAHARGLPFLVMPDYPLIHFLSNTRSALSLDWIQPQEYLGNEERLMQELLREKPVVLIERERSLTVGPAADPPLPCGRAEEPSSHLVAHVIARWRVVAEGRHFCVYRSPD
jgi:hypothetical protein